jgi:hypothetical protein
MDRRSCGRAGYKGGPANRPQKQKGKSCMVKWVWRTRILTRDIQFVLRGNWLKPRMWMSLRHISLAA